MAKYTINPYLINITSPEYILVVPPPVLPMSSTHTSRVHLFPFIRSVPSYSRDIWHKVMILTHMLPPAIKEAQHCDLNDCRRGKDHKDVIQSVF